MPQSQATANPWYQDEQNIRVFNDWKFCYEGNCSASWGLLSDAEQLREWRNFHFASKYHYGFFFLHTLPSTLAIRLEYVLFYQFYAKITTFFNKKSLVRLISYTLTSKHLAETDMKMMSRRQKWHPNVRIIILTSCTIVVLHPSCKTTFASPSQVHGNHGRVWKKQMTQSYAYKLNNQLHEKHTDQLSLSLARWSLC